MPIVFDQEEKKKKIVFDEPVNTPPPTTSTGLPALSASATPTIDRAEAQPSVSPELMSSLTPGSSQPQPAPSSPPTAAAATPDTGPVDYGQLGVDSAEAALTAGGMALGTTASLALAPVTGGASLLIPALGAAIGYAAGKSGSDLLQRAIGKKAPLNNLPDALVETAGNVQEGAMTEMGGQVVGKVLVGPIQKVLAPQLSEKVIPRLNMEELMARAEQFGIKLTPAEITQSKSLQRLENFLGNLPFSSARLQGFRSDQLEALVKSREKILDSGGGEKPLEEIGLRIRNLVDDAVKDYNNFSEENLARLKDRVLSKVGSKETYHDLIQPLQVVNEKNTMRLKEIKNTLYKNAADLMPDDLTTVPENLISVAKVERDRLMQAAPKLQDKGTIDILNSLINSPNPLNATSLVANREALNGLLAKDTNFMTGEMGPSGRIYKQMISAIDKDMEAMAEATGNEDIINARKIANRANIDYKTYVQDPLVKKIAEGKKPDAIVASVYSPGNDTEIKKFQEFYGPQFADRAKKVFTNSFLGLSPDPRIPDAPLTGDFVRTQMRRYGTTLNTIYSPAEVGYLRRVADVLDGREEMAKEVVRNPVLRSILGSPRVSGIVDLVVKPKDVGNVAIVKKYVGQPAVEEIQHALLNKILVRNQAQNFAPQTFAKAFDQYEPRVLKEVFPENVYNDLVALKTVSRRVGGAEQLAGNPSGTAGNMIIPVGFGYMMHNPISTLSLVIGSRQFTELYLSDAGRKWLTKGFILPAVSKEATTVAARITLLLLEQQKKQLEKQGEQQ